MKHDVYVQDIEQAYQILTENNNESLIAEIEQGISKVIKHVNNAQNAVVFSAIPLNHEEKERIASFIENNFQKKIPVNYKIDTQVLGGFKLVIGDWKIDATLARQIEKIKGLFTNN